MENQRTKVFQLRLTEDELAQYKQKAEDFDSVSHFIRTAVAEYSNVPVKQKLDLIRNLGLFYQKYQNELSWAGSNLNQSVKRANELAQAGLLPPAYLQQVLLPAIQDTLNLITEIKQNLDSVTRLATKL